MTYDKTYFWNDVTTLINYYNIITMSLQICLLQYSLTKIQNISSLPPPHHDNRCARIADSWLDLLR